MYQHEVELFRQQGGGLSAAEAFRRGITRKTLYAMRDAGVVVTPARGIYRLAWLAPLALSDLAAVARWVPHGVVCLASALSFHQLTAHVPNTIDVGLERGKKRPPPGYPPVRFFSFSGPAFHEGIETHEVEGVSVRIYDPEKTLVDCFRFREKMGIDLALEALTSWRERRRKKLDALLTYARTRRLEWAIKPYLETMT